MSVRFLVSFIVMIQIMAFSFSALAIEDCKINKPVFFSTHLEITIGVDKVYSLNPTTSSCDILIRAMRQAQTLGFCNPNWAQVGLIIDDFYYGYFEQTPGKNEEHTAQERATCHATIDAIKIQTDRKAVTAILGPKKTARMSDQQIRDVITSLRSR